MPLCHCGTTFDTGERWCPDCMEKERQYQANLDRAKKRMQRVLRALRGRPLLQDALWAYVRPQTREDALTSLLCLMPEAELAELKRQKKEDLTGHHHGFGRWLRNRFRLHYESGLVESCTGVPGSCGDDASHALIEALWERVQGMDFPG
jgi:hypothetical protein